MGIDAEGPRFGDEGETAFDIFLVVFHIEQVLGPGADRPAALRLERDAAIDQIDRIARGRVVGVPELAALAFVVDPGEPGQIVERRP